MSAARLPLFEFPDGRRFIAQQVVEDYIDPDIPNSPFMKREGGEENGRWVPWDEEDFRTWVQALWSEAYEFKKSETARLQRNVCYRDGFHYDSPWFNQTSATENHVWRVVETQVANTVATRPRPEIMPERAMLPDVADQLEEFATFIEESAKYDHAIYLGARDKRTFGWNVWRISGDYATGMPFAKNDSVFHFYWDPAGNCEDDCGYFIFAGPRPTWQLRAAFPEHADEIAPDNRASPAHEAIVRPWNEYLNNAASGYLPPMIAPEVQSVHEEGTDSLGTSTLVGETGETKELGKTTFTFEVIVRDEGVKTCCYYGVMEYPKGHKDYEAGGPVEGQKHVDKLPRSPSGLWSVTMTSAGLLLDVSPVDPAFLGLPFVIDRVAQTTDRFVSQSDVDHVIPIQRGINKRGRALDAALDLQAEPPVISKGADLARQLNGGTVTGGDVLEITRASEVDFLSAPGPQPQQFARHGEMKEAIREVVGLHASMEGASTGANAPAALARHLDASAQRRLQGGENPAHRARADLLRKLMYYAGKKLQGSIVFLGTDGDERAVKSMDLTLPFRIRFAEGSGSVEGRQQLEDKALALYEGEIIDELSVLEIFRWPKRNEVAARMVQRKMEQAAMEAAAAASAGPPGGNNNSPSKSAA